MYINRYVVDNSKYLYLSSVTILAEAPTLPHVTKISNSWNLDPIDIVRRRFVLRRDVICFYFSYVLFLSLLCKLNDKICTQERNQRFYILLIGRTLEGSSVIFI